MWVLFPITPGSKVPALSGDWRQHASSDPDQIEAWRDAGYDLAVDCEASGLLVVDLDGVEGLSTAASMDLPPTYTMQTPRGGKHLYYAGVGPSSVQKLGPKVDTRGTGGYVVWEAPGYDPVDERRVARLPMWIVPALHIKKDRKPTLIDGLDLEANVRRARAYLIVRKPAVEGEGGNDHTYKTICDLRDLGVSRITALELLLEEWNGRCSPPWDSEDLETIIRNAYAYGQNEEGAQAFDFNPATRFAGVAAPAPAAKKASPYRLWSIEEIEDEPPFRWLLPHIMPAEAIGVAYGPKKNGKTWLMLDVALHLATGREGYGRPESEPVDVLYYCGEGVRGLVQKRIKAWRNAKWGGQSVPHFKLLKRFPNFANDDEMDALDQEIQDERRLPKLLVLDTYARVMARAGKNENDQMEVTQFVVTMEDFKERWGCTVIAIHHSGKDLALGARGASALLAACDFSYEITADWSVKALRLRCEDMKEGEPFEPLYYEAVPHDDSLVVQGLLPNEYKALTQVDDAFSPRVVQAALARAKAFGAAAITAHVLASYLYVAGVEEPELEVQAKLDRIARKLSALGKGRYEHLVSAKGWALPE